MSKSKKLLLITSSLFLCAVICLLCAVGFGTSAVAFGIDGNSHDTATIADDVDVCTQAHNDVFGSDDGHTGTIYNGTLSDGGKYYLDADVEEGTVSVSGNVVLCLNGHSIKKIEIVGGGRLTLHDCTSTDAGNITGGVSVNGGMLVMYGGEISGNTDAQYGGGVYVKAGTFTMYGGSITGNSAENGGGVYLDNDVQEDIGSTFTMYGGVIENNIAEGSGAGVFVSANSSLVLDGGVITENQAEVGNAGGGVMSYGEVLMRKGTISANSAKFGGAVALADGGKLTMNGGSIENNEAESAGAISAVDSSVSLNGGQIVNNQADICGAMSVYNGTLTVTNTTISGNKAIRKDGTTVTDSSLTIDGQPFVVSSGTCGGVLLFNTTFNFSKGIIYGNTVEDEAGTVIAESNLVFGDSQKPMIIQAELTSATKVGVAYGVSGYDVGFDEDGFVFTLRYPNNNSSNHPLDYFVADDASQVLTVETSGAYVGEAVLSHRSIHKLSWVPGKTDYPGKHVLVCEKHADETFYFGIGAHELEHHEESLATCTEDGNYEHYYCETCDGYFSDAEGKQFRSIVTMQAGHSLVYHNVKDATCTEDGVKKEFAQCSRCEKYFANEAPYAEIEEADLGDYVEKADGHKEVINKDYNGYRPTLSTGGEAVDVYECEVCGAIRTQTHDMSLESATVVYDGHSHQLVVDGTLPDGVDVEYYDLINGKEVRFYGASEVGTYYVIARFVNHENGEAYEETPLFATLTIVAYQQTENPSEGPNIIEGAIKVPEGNSSNINQKSKPVYSTPIREIKGFPWISAICVIVVEVVVMAGIGAYIAFGSFQKKKKK